MAVPVLHRDTHHARQAPNGEPMRELDQIQQQTFQLLQSMLGASPFAGVGTWVPAVDIEETEDSWILEAELPGAKSDDSSSVSAGSRWCRLTDTRPRQNSSDRFT